MKQKLAILILALTMICGYHSVFATYSDWAEKELRHAKECGILTEQNTWDYGEPMKRGELAPILLRAYENVTGKESVKVSGSYFSDASYEAEALYRLGIMNGVGDGKFAPGIPVTREQIAKIILTLQAVCEGEELVLPSVFYNPLTDFENVSDWAKPYVEKAYANGIITGYEDGSFQGQKTVSREEAIVLLVRSVNLSYQPVQPNQEEKNQNVKPAVSMEAISTEFSWNVKSSWEAGEHTIVWSALSPNTEYVLTVTEQRNSRYEGDIPPNGPIEYRYVGQYEHPLYLYPNRTYFLTLSAGGKTLEKEIYISPIHTQEMQVIQENLPETKEEADVLMAKVTVPIWKMKSDGTKYESSVELTVHAVIAEKVEAVFTEIFHGEEQFPIKDLGAYSWRGGRSEHNWGTAIDLNANENYCVYNDGTTIGDGWFPYENPYSVTPYGEVVNAFEKYGFTWGGDAWSNPKDYMHFSYLGT